MRGVITTSKRQEIFDKIHKERERQTELWGSQWEPGVTPAVNKALILLEEVLEVVRLVNDFDNADFVPDFRFELQEELVQVAAVATAWLESMVPAEPRLAQEECDRDPSAHEMFPPGTRVRAEGVDFEGTVDVVTERYGQTEVWCKWDDGSHAYAFPEQLEVVEDAPLPPPDRPTGYPPGTYKLDENFFLTPADAPRGQEGYPQVTYMASPRTKHARKVQEWYPRIRVVSEAEPEEDVGADMKWRLGMRVRHKKTNLTGTIQSATWSRETLDDEGSCVVHVVFDGPDQRGYPCDPDDLISINEAPQDSQWLRRKKMIREGEWKFNAQRRLNERLDQQASDWPQYGADSGTHCACCGDQEVDGDS